MIAAAGTAGVPAAVVATKLLVEMPAGGDA